MFSKQNFSPIIAGPVLSSLTSEPSTYVVIKNNVNDNQILKFLMAKVRPLYLPDLADIQTITGELKACRGQIDNCDELDVANNILLIDNSKLASKSCNESLSKLGDCHKLKGVIILEDKFMENKVSRPAGLNYEEDPQFPIVSMNFRDAEFFRHNLTDIDKQKQFTSILFNSIDSLLKDDESREVLFEVDCEATACTHQKYPTSSHTSDIYFGCDGSYKKGIPVDIDCRHYGLKCPEVEQWKEKTKKDEFEKCFGNIDKISPYGPVTCEHEKNPKKPKSCDNEKEFWAWPEKYCKLQEENPKDFVFITKGCKDEKQSYYDCHEDQWGEFTKVMPGKDQQCDRNGKEQARFCRLSPDCIIIHKIVTNCDDSTISNDPTIKDLKICEAGG